MEPFFRLAATHSLGFVVAAVAICTVAGWLLAVLLVQAEKPIVSHRRWWLAGVAVVAGVGVWTTHFMAMLGYRPDVALDYDPGITALSGLIAVVAVGLPLALSATTPSPVLRPLLGAASGLGIGAMHASGMAALESCIRIQSGTASLLACLVGASCMVLARLRPSARTPSVLVCLLIVAGVCGTHFTAVSGTRVYALLPWAGASHQQIALSIFTAMGAAVLFFSGFLAVFAAQRFEAQDRAHAAILSTALQNMSNGLVFIDGEWELRLFNARFLGLFSLEAEALSLGMGLEVFFDVVATANAWDPDKRRHIEDDTKRRILSGVAETSEFAMEDGRILEIESRPLPGGGAVITFDDVTATHEAQRQIERLAFKDPLTGLANRRALQTRMEEGFAPKLRYKLLLIDLDRFKVVNDTFGHGVGDRLLVQVAERIRATVGPDEFVARLGGDEMAVLVYGDDLETSLATADAIVASLGQPFAIDDVTIAIGCSIGICCTDDAADAAELMQRSDLALYESKRQGRGRVSCYRPGLQEAITERHRLEKDLREAIDGNQFHLAYQPLVSLATDELIGYEALIRWEHPVRGMVPPASFIPLAEEAGLIVAIGRWVLEEACRAAATWPKGLHVAVNLSAVQLRSPLILSHAAAALARSGLSPHRLELEVTETAIVEDGAAVSRVLSELRRCGLRIAMDDFGTGYSSLAHLRDLSIDRIKIDRSFVAGAQTDGHCMAVLRAITQMGRDMNIATLGEGVETPEQLALLRSLGCEAAQGYLLGKPSRIVDATAIALPSTERSLAG